MKELIFEFFPKLELVRIILSRDEVWETKVMDEVEWENWLKHIEAFFKNHVSSDPEHLMPMIKLVKPEIPIHWGV